RATYFGCSWDYSRVRAALLYARCIGKTVERIRRKTRLRQRLRPETLDVTRPSQRLAQTPALVLAVYGESDLTAPTGALLLQALPQPLVLGLRLGRDGGSRILKGLLEQSHRDGIRGEILA